MKKVSFLTGLALTCTLFLSGCQRQIDFGTGGMPVDIHLTLDDTRTANDGMSTKWLNEDPLSVFYAPAGTTSYSQNTRFTVTDPEACIATGEAELTGSKYDWYLLYPYSEQVMGPAEACVDIGQPLQKQVGNDSKAHLAGETMPLYGVARNVPAGEDPTVAMHQVAAVAAVKVTNGTDQPLNVWSVLLTAPCEIVGSFSLDFSTGDPVFAPGKESAYKNVTLDVIDPEPIPVGGSASFYIAVKPFTLSAGDKLTLEVVGGEDKEKIGKQITLSGAVSFQAGYIKNLNITFAPEGTVFVVDGHEETVPEETVQAEGGNLEIPVQYNGNYTVEIEDSARSWIHHIETRTVYSDTWVFQVDPNPFEQDRQGIITFRDDEGTCLVVPVVQAAHTPSLDEVDWNKEFYHRSLFMRFTATWCTWCPRMYETVQRAQADYPDKIVHVAIHGFDSDLYLPAFLDLIDQYGVSSYPTGIVDGRVHIQNQDVDIAAPKVVAAVKETESLYGTKTGLAINSSCSGRDVDIQLTAYAKKADTYKLTVILLEDGILGVQSGYEGSGLFTHTDVARVPVTALEGDSFSIPEDNTYKSFTFRTSIPDSFNIERMKILAYIMAPQDGGYVDNCLVAPLGTRVNVQQPGSTSGGGTEGIVPGEDIHFNN